MNNDLAPLEERRARLVSLAGAQRRALANCFEPWRRPLTIADRGIAAMRFIRAHPAWIIAGALAPRALQAGRLGGWLRRGFMAWQIVSRLRSAGPNQR